MTTIAVLVGSLTAASLNKKLAANLERLAPEGVTFTYLSADLPLFSQDKEGDYPADARNNKDILAAADAVLYVTPEYNHSFTGVLKNAIDWATRPWGENSLVKPSGMVGATISPNGTKFAQAHLASIVDWFEAPRYDAEEIKLTVDDTTFSEAGEISEAHVAQLTAYIAGFSAWVAEQK